MFSLASMKSGSLGLLTNLRGWRTKRKLLVIESDDWGAIRMPSRRTWENLLAAGISVDRSRYDSLDCLENHDDFQALMDVIAGHRDASGNPATFTLNTVMGNPDFRAIEQNGFQRFHHQHFFESYRQYHDEDLASDWRLAMEAGLIRPQFHAREHLNSPLWMSDLRAGHREARLAFDHNFFGLKTRTGSLNQNNYLAAHWPDSAEHAAEIERIVDDGLDQFNSTFGFPSTTFIACNYVWPDALEGHLAAHGVTMLQTQRAHVQPDPERSGATRIRRHYTGQKNRHRQRYAVRNVLFEPYLNADTDWAEQALGQVNQSFRLGRPAVVCSHRVNYVSSLDAAHRDRNLKYLDRFLGSVRRRWPQVEFVTSDELCKIMMAKR